MFAIFQCFMLLVMVCAFHSMLVFLYEMFNQVRAGHIKWQSVKDFLFSLFTFLFGSVCVGLLEITQTGIF